ncbi:MAG: cytochrome c3 family protein [Deferrisomatales bacterium]
MRRPRARGMGIWAAALVAATLGMGGAAGAMESEDCQGCHGDPSIVKEGGGHLYIDGVRYGKTAHADVGCTSCHEAVGDGHPEDGVRPSRASCGDCHDEAEAQYQAGVHADMAGCTDCHNPHEVKPAEVVSGTELNRMCAKCHDLGDVAASHGKWLLQAELHLEAVPCITCHTGAKGYVIAFYLESVEERPGRDARVKLATHEELRGAAGTDAVERLVDTDADGSISLQELQELNREARKKGLRLWGMMVPDEVSHSYSTIDNRWDCTFCHASGSAAAQVSYLSVPQPDGRQRRFEVERGAVLDALYGTPDFYMVGTTRNDTLSWIGLLIIAGGLAMPLGHGTLRLLTMKNRREG